MDYKQEMIKRLKEDCKTLIDKKIPKALDNAVDDRGVGTYRNLTKALAENIKLIEEYDWKLMYSEYTTTTTDANGDTKKQISIWEQNSDGEIRNHKFWNVEDDKKQVERRIEAKEPRMRDRVTNKYLTREELLDVLRADGNLPDTLLDIHNKVFNMNTMFSTGFAFAGMHVYKKTMVKWNECQTVSGFLEELKDRYDHFLDFKIEKTNDGFDIYNIIMHC